MRATSGLFKGLNPTVTVVSVAIVVIFVLLCALKGDQAATVFKTASDAILENFKWLYLAVVSGMLGTLLMLACSRYGTLKLGRENDTPEFSFGAWIAMPVSYTHLTLPTKA